MMTNLMWVVVNADGTYAGVPCLSWEEALELKAAGEGRRAYVIDVSECDVTETENGLM